ncbi:universal stress protein [Streptomyces sannanensis]|uniref:Universal stress protein n=1 Tax=Streptomyces sannanensis TaxID=285536 RepID=A0ABP6SKI4_9ACTN
MGDSRTGGPELGWVVAGVDGSADAMTAALWAAAEADRRGQPLNLVHAMDTEGRDLYVSAEMMRNIRRTGNALLEDAAAQVAQRFPGLRVTTELSPLEPSAGLHDVAGGHGTIVIGNRGLGGFTALLLGSVGLRVAAGAQGPVVVVRAAGEGVDKGVVLAAVRDRADLECVRHAARAAQLRTASLRLLSVRNVLHLGEIAQEHEQQLREVAGRIHEEFPGLTVTEDIDKGSSVAGALVEASRRADLLVMGGRRAPHGISPTLGRVTHAVLHHAHCPVELIPRVAKPAPTG